jgi:dihydroflavonol-4-reductase
VFVTGATGFVGGALLRHLSQSGREVVALVRSDAGRDAVARLGARPVRGDVLEPGSLEAIDGCDTVFHVAGVHGACPRDTGPMVRVNVEGTRNVIEAAARAGVRRVVQTSSAAAIGEQAGEIAREDTPHRGWFLTAYEGSKVRAERLAFARGRELGLEVVCVSPASVQGPGRVEGTARLLLAHLRGHLPILVDTRFSLVDVDDCARGHLLAETRGAPGERYLLSGATLTVGEAARALAGRIGVRRRFVLVPARAVAVFGGPTEALFRALGRRPPFCRELGRALVHGRACDGSRATRELGLVYTSLEETLARTVAWFIEQGLV